MIRLSFLPIDEYLAARYPEDLWKTPEACLPWFGYPDHTPGEFRFLGPRSVAPLLGPIRGLVRKGTGIVSDRTIARWRCEGVSVWQADRIATALALTPDCPTLWGVAWSDAVDETVDRWIASEGRRYEPPAVDDRHPATPLRRSVAA